MYHLNVINNTILHDNRWNSIVKNIWMCWGVKVGQRADEALWVRGEGVARLGVIDWEPRCSPIKARIRAGLLREEICYETFPRVRKIHRITDIFSTKTNILSLPPLTLSTTSRKKHMLSALLITSPYNQGMLQLPQTTTCLGMYKYCKIRGSRNGKSAVMRRYTA